MKKTSIILFVLTLISVPIAFFVVFIASNGFVFVLPTWGAYLWICFLFIPIPISSIIFGLIRTDAKKEIYKKNVISGSLVTFYLLIASIASFQDFNRYSWSDSYLNDIRENTGLYIPTRVNAAFRVEKYGREGNAEITKKEEQILFLNSMEDSSWLSELPSFINNTIPTGALIHTANNFDYYCLYIIENDCFNPTSLPSGEYNAIYLAYRTRTHLIYSLDNFKIII